MFFIHLTYDIESNCHPQEKPNYPTETAGPTTGRDFSVSIEESVTGVGQQTAGKLAFYAYKSYDLP